MEIDVKTIERHRNGVCGVPFHVVLFDWRDDAETQSLRVEMTYSETRSFIKQAEAYTAKYPENQGREGVRGADGG